MTQHNKIPSDHEHARPDAKKGDGEGLAGKLKEISDKVGCAANAPLKNYEKGRA